jgi:transcriptional regulator GlxA family with amidase domain
MIDIVIFLPEQTFPSTAIGPMDVFTHAGSLWNVCTGSEPSPAFRVSTVSTTGNPVQCEGPLQLRPTMSIKDVRKADVIFIPSTGISVDDVARRNEPMIPWLQKWHARGAAIACVCSGVGLVAETGLLDGRRATTHWGIAEHLRGKYPNVNWMPELLVTEDRNIYCGGGMNAALDLSLYLVERYCGHEVAVQAAKALLLETPRSWQSGFALTPLNMAHDDEAISRAQDWLHKNLHRTFPVDAPAEHVGMSLRNFVRRFKAATGDSPIEYLQKVRVAAAKRLLENSHKTVQEISEAVGYSDAAFFRSLFKRLTGIPPVAYRERFGT